MLSTMQKLNHSQCPKQSEGERFHFLLVSWEILKHNFKVLITVKFDETKSQTIVLIQFHKGLRFQWEFN